VSSGGGVPAVLTAWATADDVEAVMQAAASATRSVTLTLEKIPGCEVWELDLRGLTRRKCIGMNPPTAVLPEFSVITTRL